MNTRRREAFFLVLLLALSIPVRSQDDNRVKRISGETADGLFFTAWTESFVVPFGQDIVVNYEVRNRSAKTIYLVEKDGPLKVRVEEDIHTLFIEAPFPTSHHGAFNYDFIQVPKGKSHRGRFIITLAQYQSAAYWDIVIGFGYVTDITGMEKKSGGEEDPLSLTLLQTRGRSIGLGYLDVEVKRP